MKMIHSSLVATFVTVFAAAGAPYQSMASDARLSKSALSAIGAEQSLLAQAETGSSKPNAKGPQVNVDQNGVILKAYDAVAYFKQKRAVKGDPKFSSSYGGATYYFASADDKATFEKTPAKYAPQYGGYCAHSMMKRKLGDIDPNVFFVYKGKLYVCSSPKAEKPSTLIPTPTSKRRTKTGSSIRRPPTRAFIANSAVEQPVRDPSNRFSKPFRCWVVCWGLLTKSGG